MHLLINYDKIGERILVEKMIMFLDTLYVSHGLLFLYTNNFNFNKAIVVTHVDIVYI